MVKVCRYCHGQAVLPGQRGKFISGVCSVKRCRINGLFDLAEQDMISREEADELNLALMLEGS